MTYSQTFMAEFIECAAPNYWRYDGSDRVFAPHNRLRAAGVDFEDRQDLLGHKSERITTHYSALDIARLIAAAEKVCERRANTVLRVAVHTILTRAKPKRCVDSD